VHEARPLSRDNSRRNAALALVALSLIWGYNFVVMKKVMQYVDPFQFSAMRTVLGAATLFLVLGWLRKPMRPVALGPTFLLGLLQTAAFTALLQWALVSGAAGKTSVLTYTMPFWLLLFARVGLGERIQGLQWAAVAAAAVGLVFILEPWQAQGNPMSSALAVAGGMTWALSAVVAKRLRARVELDLLSLTAWQMLLGSLLLVVVALVLPPARPLEINGYFIGALAYNAVCGTGLAWVLWLYVLDKLSAGVAGLSSLSVPAVGVLAAWLQLGERPSGSETAGMALIAAALGLLSIIASARQRQVEHPAVQE
jgi:drug/metabolite transporter (DMT)-like permease